MKLVFQKLNWINVAGFVFMTAMAFVPVLLPNIAHAQQQPPISCPQDLGYLCTDGTVASMFRLILNWALTLAFLMAVIYLIYGGFLYIASAGNAEQATKGRTTLINALIGMVIIVLSYTIVQIVYGFVTGGANGVSGT